MESRVSKTRRPIVVGDIVVIVSTIADGSKRAHVSIVHGVHDDFLIVNHIGTGLTYPVSRGSVVLLA